MLNSLSVLCLKLLIKYICKLRADRAGRTVSMWMEYSKSNWRCSYDITGRGKNFGFFVLSVHEEKGGDVFRLKQINELSSLCKGDFSLQPKMPHTGYFQLLACVQNRDVSVVEIDGKKASCLSSFLPTFPPFKLKEAEFVPVVLRDPLPVGLDPLEVLDQGRVVDVCPAREEQVPSDGHVMGSGGDDAELVLAEVALLEEAEVGGGTETGWKLEKEKGHV